MMQFLKDQMSSISLDLYEEILEVYSASCLWHADKHQSFLQIDTIILGVCISRHGQSTQISFHIFATFPEKHEG